MEMQNNYKETQTTLNNSMEMQSNNNDKQNNYKETK